MLNLRDRCLTRAQRRQMRSQRIGLVLAVAAFDITFLLLAGVLAWKIV